MNKLVTMKIKDMMCLRCEGRIKSAIESVEGVERAMVSHVTGSAEVMLSADVSNEELKKAVEITGYEVLSVE